MLQSIETVTRTRINVYVQPRASRSGVAGMHDGALRIRLTSPPVDGAANAMLVELIAGKLGLAKRCVRIVRGSTGRRKLIEIDGLSEAAAIAALLAGETGPA
jgi:uncharacterized protein (TIGR00251 family)